MTKGLRVHARRFESRWRRRAGAVLSTVLAVWAMGTSVGASVVVPLTLAQLTREASTIVDAVVTEVRVVQGPSGAERLVLVRVASTWKGMPDDTLYVRLPGGRLGRTETLVSGAPTVTTGDRVVWFLDPHPRGGHVVLGLHQGVLRAQPGPDGQVRVLAPPRQDGTRGDARRVPRRLAEIEADVRALLAGEVAQ